MREIKGYEGLYAINNKAEIINIRTGKTRKTSVGNHGYLTVDLYRNGHRKTFLVHRLMAETFLENEENKRTINHKDGNKLNNCLSNLEWATYSENHKHSYDKLGRKAYMKGRKGVKNHNSKPIIKLTIDNIPLRKFQSIMDAERETGILNNSIVNCLKGRTRTSGGYKWRYANET